MVPKWCLRKDGGSALDKKNSATVGWKSRDYCTFEILADNRGITGPLFRYTWVSSKNKNYGFERLIVVPGFASNIRHSNIRQWGLPRHECWRKSEWQIIESAEFLFLVYCFPKHKKNSKHQGLHLSVFWVLWAGAILAVTCQNLLSQNLLSQNLLCQNLLCQNLLNQNLLCQNLLSQNLLCQNLLSQNLLCQNLLSQNLLSQNLLSQNLLSQNLLSQNLLSQNLLSQNLLSQNLLSWINDRVI